MITFDELHDKLVEYEAFLMQEELRSTSNLGTIKVNNTQFSSSHCDKNASQKYFPSRKGYQGQRPPHFGNQHPSKKATMICQFSEKKGHTACQCYIAKKLFLSSTPTTSPIIPTNNSLTNWFEDISASHLVTFYLNNLSLCQPMNLVINIFHISYTWRVVPRLNKVFSHASLNIVFSFSWRVVPRLNMLSFRI